MQYFAKEWDGCMVLPSEKSEAKAKSMAIVNVV